MERSGQGDAAQCVRRATVDGMGTRQASLLLAFVLVASACSSAVQSSGVRVAEPSESGQDAATSAAEPSAATTDATTTTTTDPPATTTPETSTTTSTSTTTTTTTTTTTVPPLDVYDIACAIQVLPGETMQEIVALIDDDTVDVETVMAENGLENDVVIGDQILDVCVDNGLNDIDGTTRTERNAVLVRREVETQQAKLNTLFAGYGIRELLVDGISGSVTQQRLCAFRLAAGLPVSTKDMAAGSEEEQLLMATETLPIPFTSAILAERWALIDETCQIMFVGVGTERLQFVFPTSSGLADFPTRPQTRSSAFKYDSASNNNGWHNSTDFPAAEDNPLNGNMYKPIYFDNGQAIHGANNVPRSPASHGCLRLRVTDMDSLINWLGLGDVTGATYDTGKINLAVNVQGRYVGSG